MQSSVQNAHATQLPLAQARLLIVDDSADMRDLIASMVRSLPIQVFQASCAQEALTILATTPVDAVLSDLVMPQMSGMMLLHEMLERGIDRPFVLLTGYSDKDSAIQALRLGAFDYLEKPINELDLQTVVSAALRKGQHGPEPASIESFSDDARRQLDVCEALLSELETGRDIERDLRSLLALVTSLRDEAKSAQLVDVAQFAATLQECLVALNARPSESTEQFYVLREALRILQEKVAVIADPRVAAVRRRLEAVTARSGNFGAPPKHSD